jgi:hypothetical protein
MVTHRVWHPFRFDWIDPEIDTLVRTYQRLETCYMGFD